MYLTETIFIGKVSVIHGNDTACVPKNISKVLDLETSLQPSLGRDDPKCLANRQHNHHERPTVVISFPCRAFRAQDLAVPPQLLGCRNLGISGPKVHVLFMF